LLDKYNLEYILVVDWDGIRARIRLLGGDLSQQEFADCLGYELTYIEDVEEGRLEPSLDYILALSKKFNVKVDWIVLGGPEDTDGPSGKAIPRPPVFPIDSIEEALKIPEEYIFEDS